MDHILPRGTVSRPSHDDPRDEALNKNEVNALSFVLKAGCSVCGLFLSSICIRLMIKQR